MSDTPLRFVARLLRPATPKGATWTFLLLPGDASAALPSRGLVTVEGALADAPFQATLQPDGKGGHWMKVPKALLQSASVRAGDEVHLQIAPIAEEPEPKVPAPLRAALAAEPAAKLAWKSLTPVGRRDWIHWIESAKKAETVERRIATTCDMLASGKRRVCCFDRSGIYGGGMAAPQAMAD
ncbi:MAG: DUF1905 domain-containing protein [Xanthomonadales bacterium]|nr:DUF1905 domain-containing protein [Xanthomonadales bacterium]